jgi:hypothetical protein
MIFCPHREPKSREKVIKNKISDLGGGGGEEGYGVYTPLSTIFQLYRGDFQILNFESAQKLHVPLDVGRK